MIGVDERKPEADLRSFDDVDWDHVDYVMSSPVFNPAPHLCWKPNAVASP